MSINKSKPENFGENLPFTRDSHKSIMKSTSILSVGTVSSRVLGFVRDVILAKLLGTGFRADAFFVALKIPNLFRDLVGEGATNAAVVPVLSEYSKDNDKKKLWEFISIILSLGLILLSVITILGIIFAPLVVRMIAPGFISNPEKLELTIRLTQVMFPYLIFIGLTAYSTGILFTFRSFLIPAFTPCLLNVALITAALIASRTMQEPVFGLAIGVLAGGILQLLFQIRPMIKSGFKWYKPKTLRHSGAAKIGKLLIPRIIGSGVYQLTVLVDTFCASLAFLVGAGGISAIYYANRIIQFPMGVFGVAMASAVLPTLSDYAHKNDLSSVKKMLIFALENIFFIMCPTIIILVLLANPIIRILFERGEFGTYSTEITSWALSFYALGLFSFGGIKILVTAFHALQDTKTPVKVAALCLCINATLNFLLMVPLKVGGIALASAIAGTIDFLILFYIMNKKLGRFEASFFWYFLKVSIASLVTGIFIFWSWHSLFLGNEMIKLFIIGMSSYIFYEIVCLIFQIEQAWKILKYAKMGLAKFQKRS